MDNDRWIMLIQALHLPDNADTYSSLLSAYSQKHRHYHTIDHIDACLSHLDNVVDLADSPPEIELALWFHDAIYDPYSSGNERKSAKWAKKFLLQNIVDKDLISRIHELIMVTVHGSPCKSKDETILADIDLSILGSEAGIYNKFEEAIRKEYRRVPYFLYRKKRNEILQGFLSRDQIYQNQYFNDRFEKQARKNMSAVIHSRC